MKKGIGYTILGLLFGAGAYGVWWYYRQRELIANAQVTFGSLEFVNLNFPEIEVNVYLNVLNRSDISITAKNYSLDVSLNEKPMTNLSWNGEVPIAAKQTSKFPLRVKLNLKNFAQSGLKSLVNFLGNMGKPLKLRIVGKLSAKTAFATINSIPIDETFDLGALLKKKMTSS